jgi:probable HAF family extracellular repeat protein
MHRTVAVLALAALAATTGFAQAKPATRSMPRYKLVELPLRPLSISDAAFVAGTTPDQKAAIWSSHGGLQKIDLPAEFPIAEATAINRHGDAVGTAYTADSGRRLAFLFRQRKVLILAGEQSHALGLNDAGTIVGQARVPGGKSTEPVVWRNPDQSKNNPPEALRVCCAGVAKAVTRRGQIVGDTYDAEGRYHAFLWAGDGRTRRLGLPSEQFSSALALNDLGQVVLRSDPAGLFLYQAGKRQRLELPHSRPLALNNHGVIVGSFGAKPEEQRAFVWDKARGRQDLNRLISHDPTWTLEVASSVNDRGEIVGWGEHNHTENAGFLLIPQ